MSANHVTDVLRTAFHTHRADIHFHPQIPGRSQRAGDFLGPVTAFPVNTGLLRHRPRQERQHYPDDVHEFLQWSLPFLASSIGLRLHFLESPGHSDASLAEGYDPVAMRCSATTSQTLPASTLF